MIALLKLTRDIEDAARILSEKLGCLPLAIDQAGAYIASNQIPLNAYIELYERNRKAALSWGPENAIRKYREGVLTTWEVSFNAIEEENPKAAELLLLCGFLANDDISEEIFRRGWKLEEDGMLHHIPLCL